MGLIHGSLDVMAVIAIPWLSSTSGLTAMPGPYNLIYVCEKTCFVVKGFVDIPRSHFLSFGENGPCGLKGECPHMLEGQEVLRVPFYDRRIVNDNIPWDPVFLVQNF
jgi:hypothetical protein